MKTVFDINYDITYHKPIYTLTPSDEFVPYMVQRWLSFIDPVYCNLLNEIYNLKTGGFSDNQQLYDYFKCILPKKNIFKIPYVKKNKPTAEISDSANIIAELSRIYELPESEIKDMLEINDNVINSFKDDTKVLKKL